MGSVAANAAAAGAPNHDLNDEVLQRESAGDLAGARRLLEQRAGSDRGAAAALAEFLERHGDPRRRDAYLKWAAQETDPDRRKLALRQVVLLDVLDGQRSDLPADVAQYRAAGGSDLTPASNLAKSATFSTVMIPGPLSSFARMAALSPEVRPEELLPALARNVVTNGYEAAGNEALQQTEYMKLLVRYLGEARELQ